MATPKKTKAEAPQLPPQLAAMLPKILGPGVNAGLEKAFLRWRWSELYRTFLEVGLRGALGGEKDSKVLIRWAALRADEAWEEEHERAFSLVSL